MPTNVIVPSLGESVTEAVLLRWLKQNGELVAKDEMVVELETDKANVDIPAKASGVLRHGKQPGDTVQVGEAVAQIEEAGAASTAPGAAPAQASSAPATPASAGPASGPSKVAPPPHASRAAPEDLSPAVRRIVEENKVDAAAVKLTGPGGRITKEDALKHVEASAAPAPAAVPSAPATASAPAMAASSTSGGNGAAAAPQPPPLTRPAPAPAAHGEPDFDADGVKRVPMSKIRKRIAENLLRAQQTAAILTTFNEVDLTNVMALRTKFKERFQEVHGVGLGFMSFFARAVVLALREFPRVNAFLEGDDVVYHSYVHLGIAVSTDRGLTVPILRNAESMGFAKIESEIKRLATAARDGKLGLQELSGGTFTVTNGGVFGSLLSTPILNPPQSGILGMHAIQKRPVAVGDKVEVHPMMYVALSYDHRIVDGRESVSFLVRMKEYLEDPARLMLEI